MQGISEGPATPIFDAVCRGNATDVIGVLLADGAAVSAVNTAGCTPLHEAAVRGNAQVVEALLKKGADASAEVEPVVTTTALVEARPNGPDILYMLIAGGAVIPSDFLVPQGALESCVAAARDGGWERRRSAVAWYASVRLGAEAALPAPAPAQ